ncbi:pyridoxal kinase PdxY [Caldimonas brevitalea]|uniref:pyridoxal kinase n=1 Tax=Caldimonas brevitalea TaxID=413882 RepID=A0A0G3BK67_9BURK|nr:pyridoxal kinase PdxY [Caldimonas brevitalea]AKJ26945.1 pyridoxamine kinase [Caldimonas brevitalea]
MSAPRHVLTIQSHVAYGHVGNAAAVFPLQRLGLDPVVIHTVQFSNHTGYGEFKGQVFSADHVLDVLDGLRAREVLQQCEAVLSGYLGDAAIGEAILQAVAEIRAARGEMLYCCDPVMGDTGRGLFVRPGIPEFHRLRAVAQADLITPNQFEFEQLLGRPVVSREDAVTAARSMAPKAVVITSLRTPDVPPDRLETLAVTHDGAWSVSTPFVPLTPLPNGMGDVFSALLLGRLLNGDELPDALSHAVSALYTLVLHTVPGSRDLPLIAQQCQLVEPTQRFEAQPLDVTTPWGGPGSLL